MSDDIAELGVRLSGQGINEVKSGLRGVTVEGKDLEGQLAKLTGGNDLLTKSMLLLVNAIHNETGSLNSNQSSANATAQAHYELARSEALAAQQARENSAAQRAVGEASRAAAVQAREQAKAQRELEASLNNVVGVHAKVVTSSKAATQAGLNLTRQFADVGVTAAMGMNPLMILIQQGPQIADAFQQAATQGMSAGSVFKALAMQLGILKKSTDATALAAAEQAVATQGQAVTAALAAQANARLAVSETEAAAAAQVATVAAAELAAANTAVAETAAAAAAAETVALSPLLPIIAGIALAIGGVTAALAIGAREINKGFGGDLTKSMDLTEKQLDKLRDKTGKLKDVGVTMGDTLKAVFQVTGDRIGNALAGPLGWVSDKWSEFYKWLIESTVRDVQIIVGTFYAAYNIIVETWKRFPAVFGDLVATGANLAITAVEGMINFVGDKINILINFANAAADKVKLPSDMRIPTIDKVELGRVQNDNAGAMNDYGKAIMQAGKDGMAQGAAAVTDFIGDVAEQAIKNGEKRLRNRIGKVDENKGRQDHSAENFQRETDAINANVEGLLALAAAYLVSDEAAMRADAHRKAVVAAIKGKDNNPASIAAREQALLNQTAAEGAVEADKATRAMIDQTAVQDRLNGLVADGTMTREQANRQLELENELHPLIAMGNVADANTRKTLTKAIDAETAARLKANQAKDNAKVGDSTVALQNQIAVMQLEVQMIGAGNAARAVELAQLQAKQALKGSTADPAVQQAYTDALVTQAKLEQERQARQDNYNASLTATSDRLSVIGQQAAIAGNGLQGAFGNVGNAISSAVSALTDYKTNQAKAYEDLIAASDKYDFTTEEGRKALSRASQQYSDDTKTNELQNTSAMIGAAKSLFNEKSTGFKIVQAVETAYHAIRMAQSLAAMTMGTVETATTVAQNGVKATSFGVVAFAHTLASLPFPFNLAAGAAVLAALAGIGVAIAGGGGGGASVAPVDPTDARQAAQGTGTAGDATTQSASINKSLALAEKYQNQDLQYSNDQLTSLRNIDAGIGTLTDKLSRTITTGGALDTSDVYTGTTGSKGFLSSKSTTVELADNGLTFAVQSLTDAINNGVQGQSYVDTKTTTTKKSLFGGSTKTSMGTSYTGLDSDLEAEFGRVLGEIQDSVLKAASALGQKSAQDALDNFMLDLGTMSFEGLNASEIQAQLNAVFSKAGDQIALAAVPLIGQFTQVGEGAFETLQRVVKDVATVTTSFQAMGKPLNATGEAAIIVSEQLIKAAGGLENFTSQSRFFTENFLSETEQMAPVIKAVSTEMERVQNSGVTTVEQFKKLVLGLDTTDAAQAKLYQELMNIAPAFYKVAQYNAELNGTLTETISAIDLTKQTRQLEIELMDAQGNAAGALAARREDELKALNAMSPSLGVLKQAIWDAQDAATTAAKALAEATALNASRDQINIRILNAQGKTAEAQAIQRRIELAGTAESLRPLLIQLWNIEDASAAATKAAAELATKLAHLAEDNAQSISFAQDAVTRARNDLSTAYDRERGTLEDTISSMDDFAKSFRDFRMGLETSDTALSPEARYQALSTQFRQVSAAAANGDAEAMGRLQNVSQEYLDASRDYYASSEGYYRDFETVRSALLNAENSARAQSSVASQQLSALNTQVGQLMGLNVGIQSVNTTLAAMYTAIQTLASASIKAASFGAAGSGVANPNRQWSAEGLAAGNPNEAANVALALATGYSGNFGSGGFNAFIQTADSAAKEAARQVLTQAGQTERINFATGAMFKAEGVYTRPTERNIARFAESGPEAIMPLTNVGGKMGVHAAIDPETRKLLAKQNELLTGIMARIEGGNLQRGEAAMLTLERLGELVDTSAKGVREQRRAK